MNPVESLLPLLNKIKPISLNEMDSVALMDRFDTKFVFRFENISSFLETLQNDYQVLVVKDLPYATYKNLYFDTPDHDFYFEHHNGRGHRCKVRFRQYAESDLSFFEVKVKNNKGKTVKTRMISPAIADNLGYDLKQMAQLAFPDVNADLLKPALWNNFNRITLVNVELKERVTIDFNLHFRDGKQDYELKDFAVAEVKHEMQGRFSPFISLMLQERIKEFSISKYCVGRVLTINSIKHNNFKEQLINIQKLMNQHVA